MRRRIKQQRVILQQVRASYDYQRGPDGRNYAVGGEVSIDTSKGATPEETLRKAQTIKRAALAPANPSGQDRTIAQAATLMIIEAQQEILATRIEESGAEQQASNNNTHANQESGSNINTYTYDQIQQAAQPANTDSQQSYINYLV